MLVRGKIECAADRWEVHLDEVIDMDERLADQLTREGIVEPIGQETAALMAPEHATKPPRKQRLREEVTS